MELLNTPSKLGDNGTNLVQKKKYTLTVDPSRSGKHGDVFFVFSPQNHTYAIKRQVVKSPLNPSDRAYRELKVLKHLSEINCDHFVSMHDWFKVRTPLALDSNTPPSPHQYMHYILEYAEICLAKVKVLSLSEYKSVLFQILFALYKAQKHLGMIFAFITTSFDIQYISKIF
jgi:hypothetical protein